MKYFKNAKVGRGGVVFKLGLYCFKISSGLGLYYFLKGVRFYSRVGLHLRGYGNLMNIFKEFFERHCSSTVSAQMQPHS